MMDCGLKGLVVLTLAVSVTSERTRTIETKLGSITGMKRQHGETKEFIYEFRGIRYAKAPVGNLRFLKPIPEDPWKDTYDATQFGSACPQAQGYSDAEPLKMAEDCLFLNIYVPKTLSKSQKRSVMIWIHGGSFQSGTSSNYDGSRIALEGDVIVVTLNYRLGIFGFLSFLNPTVRGNYGIWDQKTALEWVHNNIEDYGGDPESATLFGQGAGGVSVMLHSFIPSNKGLFQRVISQSGVISRTVVLDKGAISRGVTGLEQRTGCTADDPNEFIDCLRKKSFQDLIEQSNEAESLREGQIMLETMFSPCVDGELFSEHPVKLLEDTNSDAFKLFADLDFIAGTTSLEGSILHELITEPIQKHYDFNKEISIPSKFLCDGLIEQFVKSHSVKETSCKYYSSDSSVEQSIKSLEFMADYISTSAHAHALDQHAGYGGGETYQYLFSRQSPLQLPYRPAWSKGAWHGDDLVYLSILKDSHGSFSREDKELSVRMIQYWTSFAKTGKPYGGSGSYVWLSYDTNGRIYLDFDNPFSMKSYLRREAVELWTKEIPTLIFEQENEGENADKLSDKDEL